MIRFIRKQLAVLYVLADDIVVGITNLMDRAKLGRKVMLYSTLYLTFNSYSWAKSFVETHDKLSGVEIGAVVAAVLLPISYLQKSVFDTYSDSTKAQTFIPDAPTPEPGASSSVLAQP